MKITVEHYAILHAAIARVDTPVSQAAYRNAGLTEKRYRWDCLRSAGLMTFVCDVLYKYVDDTHIDSALRKITNTNVTGLAPKGDKS